MACFSVLFIDVIIDRDLKVFSYSVLDAALVNVKFLTIYLQVCSILFSCKHTQCDQNWEIGLELVIK